MLRGVKLDCSRAIVHFAYMPSRARALGSAQFALRACTACTVAAEKITVAFLLDFHGGARTKPAGFPVRVFRSSQALSSYLSLRAGVLINLTAESYRNFMREMTSIGNAIYRGECCVFRLGHCLSRYSVTRARHRAPEASSHPRSREARLRSARRLGKASVSRR